MRVAIYNQMFGLNGKSFFSSIAGHWAIHFQGDKERIWARTNLDRTMDIIRKSNADIIGICEILEGQEDELKEKLKKIGYKYIHFGEGHRTKFRKLHIKVAIASKKECRKEYIEQEPIENKLGGGGGFIDCFFPRLKLNVLNVHLGTRNKLRTKQLKFLKNHLKRKGKFILMGDFNCSYGKLRKYFSDLNIVTNELRTCSLTPIIKWFFWKDCDHIFVRNLKCVHLGFIEGFSDHRLVYVDLK